MKLTQITDTDTHTIKVVTDKGHVLWNVTPEKVKQMSKVDFVKFTSVLEKCDERVEVSKKRSNKKGKKMRLQIKKQTPKRNPFAGADDIYITKNKIAVTTTTNSRTVRGFVKTKKTKYYVQNADNLRKLRAAKGNTVRVGRKGTNYKEI